jgi:hypothetical protein
MEMGAMSATSKRDAFAAGLGLAFLIALACAFMQVGQAPGVSGGTTSTGSGTVSANNGSAGALCEYAAAGGSTVCGPSPDLIDGGTGNLSIGAAGVGTGQITLIGTTSGSVVLKCNAGVCTSFSTVSPFLFQAAGGITLRHLNQQVANDMAGSCAMSASTTCTFSIQSTYTNYLSFVSQDHASVGSLATNMCGASLSGTTVTVTCLNSNSLTWDAWIIGNAN